MTRISLPATILACLATAALVAASAPAKPVAKTGSNVSGLQRDLDALVAAGAPGAILFIRDGDHTTRLAAGLGDLARKTPMRAENHFKIASLTKTFTATVLLQLVSEGKLSLNDSVEQRLLLNPAGQLQKYIFGNVAVECESKWKKQLIAEERNAAITSDKFELLGDIGWHRIFSDYVLLASERREQRMPK